MDEAKVVLDLAAPDVAKAALGLEARVMVVAMTPVEVRTVLAAKADPVAKVMAAAMTPAEVRVVPAARVMAAATTPAVAKAPLVPAVKALPAARARPIDIDSPHAPWPHFLAGHGASGGNP